MPDLPYGLKVWEKTGQDKMNEKEKIQGRALKKIFNLPISTSNIDLIMETATWSANQRIQHSTMMFYLKIMNSDRKRVARKIWAEHTINNYKNIMISKVQQTAHKNRS